MPTVSIAHTEDRHRSREKVYAMLREALKLIGGFDAFVRPGQTVLIRPDQSVSRLAEEGATTDPLLIGAIIRLAHESGAAKVRVGASSSGFLNSLDCMKITGIAAVAAEEGAELIDLGSDRVPNREIDLLEAELLPRIPLPVPLLEADAIVAVPKARTDSLDRIAGSVEFCAGGLNQIWRARQSCEDDILERFADILMAVRPDLSIIDALICGEGDGPHASMPRWGGCILACADPVAADIVTASLLGIDWSKLRFAAAAEERGLGNTAPMVILGTPIERVMLGVCSAHEGFEHLPVTVLTGKGATRFGTIRHVKSALETLVRRGLLQQALHHAGAPTIMVGDVDDPEFERHISEGPYIVFDDSAQPKYKEDPRVFFVPGHPVLSGALEELIRILKLEKIERFIQKRA